MNQQIDVARRTGGCILGAANQVKRLHPKHLGIEFRSDPLGHAETPAPVFLDGSIHDLDVRIRGVRRFGVKATSTLPPDRDRRSSALARSVRPFPSAHR